MLGPPESGTGHRQGCRCYGLKASAGCRWCGQKDIGGMPMLRRKKNGRGGVRLTSHVGPKSFTQGTDDICRSAEPWLVWVRATDVVGAKRTTALGKHGWSRSTAAEHRRKVSERTHAPAD